MTEENKYGYAKLLSSSGQWTEVSEKIDITREEVLSNLKKAPFSSHNKSLWWKSIGWYFEAVNSGHISGEWVTPQYTGYKPIRIDEHGSIIKPHHS